MGIQEKPKYITVKHYRDTSSTDVLGDWESQGFDAVKKILHSRLSLDLLCSVLIHVGKLTIETSV